jgi:hypothetical protein
MAGTARGLRTVAPLKATEGAQKPHTRFLEQEPTPRQARVDCHGLSAVHAPPCRRNPRRLLLRSLLGRIAAATKVKSHVASTPSGLAALKPANEFHLRGGRTPHPPGTFLEPPKRALSIS